MDASTLDTEFQEAKKNPDTNIKFIEEKSKEYGVEPEVFSTVIDNVPEVNQLYKEDKLAISVKPSETEAKIEKKPDEKINDLASRIIKGDKIESAEDLQLQQNFPKEIETAIKNASELEGSANEAISDREQIVKSIASTKTGTVMGDAYVAMAREANTPELQQELIDTIYSQAEDNRGSMNSIVGKDVVEKIYKLKEKDNAVQKQKISKLAKGDAISIIDGNPDVFQSVLSKPDKKSVDIAMKKLQNKGVIKIECD